MIIDLQEKVGYVLNDTIVYFHVLLTLEPMIVYFYTYITINA